MNKISLAIPFYNNSQYFFDSIKYAIHDNFVDEIVVVDDHSNLDEYGNLIHLVKNLNSSKIKVFRNEKNLKAFRNKYETVSKCNNDWIYLLDSDNYFSEDSLNYLKEIDLNSNLCYLPSRLLLSSGETVEYQFEEDLIGIVESKKHLKLQTKYMDWILNMGNFLINKNRYLSSLENANCDESLNLLHADVFAFSYYWFLSGGKYKIVNGLSYHHRLRENSYWHLCGKKSQESVDYYTQKVLEMNNQKIRITDCPEEFLPKMPVVYPPHQGDNPMIEERAYNFFKTKEDLQTDYIYIPIQWTSFHIQNDYGKNLEPLVEYCTKLTEQYPNERFFTVVQYDGGTLIEIDNCIIFGCSGNFNSPSGKNSKYEPLPLLSDPHSGDQNQIKKYKVGYAGWDTHPIRTTMYNALKDIDGYKLVSNLSENKVEIFKDILYNSIFALSPRGYGPASYRMYEAIQMGCIPIYISDEFWLPFKEKIEWEKMCLLIVEDQIETIPLKVDQLIESGEYLNMIQYGQEVYQKYLNWDGCLNTIIDYIT